MLTGEYATEVSDASGMQLLDVPNRCWSDELLDLLDIDKSLLAKVYESPEVTGTITAQVAAMTGLQEGTIVVGGAGDNAAAAVGTGIVEDGKPLPPSALAALSLLILLIFLSTPKGPCTYLLLCCPRLLAHYGCHPRCWTLPSNGLGTLLPFEEISAGRKEGVDPYYIMDNMAEKIPSVPIG